MSRSTSSVSLKLLVHKTSRKILFGQADKNFIDFLFTILVLPVSTILNLLSTKTTVEGPLRNLYHSLQNLDTNDFREVYHNFLLKPQVQIPESLISSISLLPLQSSVPKGYYYSCSSSSCRGYYATATNVLCPQCRAYMNKEMKLAPLSPNGEMTRVFMMKDKIGYVKDKVSYIVMDDLTLKPMSAMSTISLLAEFGVEDVSLIQETIVYLDHKQGLDLLRASFCSSSTVLSDVFLHKIDFEDSKAIEVDEEKVKNFNLQL